jgi:hypothetical protein
MLALAAGKTETGNALENPVLLTEGRVTLIDAYLAGAILSGLALNATLGWWWADPLAGLVIVYLRPARRQARAARTMSSAPLALTRDGRRVRCLAASPRSPTLKSARLASPPSALSGGPLTAVRSGRIAMRVADADLVNL